ncbi:MAG: dephospho-CoA kinase [Zoogloeaceae bacterium]|jgi:dephospho-CoA kinase|nr:dephospho-CoA kinase [Zoogloeaceae bacterium]
MFRVGLTGGIGSGKSTVAEAFAQLGAGLVDTDLLAHRLTARHGAALPALTAAFGADILAADGSLDRVAMRRRVFADPAARTRLENILHPMIRQLAREEGIALEARAPYVLLAIPLLVETNGRKTHGLDRVLVVDCPEILQIERVMARNGLSRAEAQAIIAAQATRAARLVEADDVIDNSGDLSALAPVVARLHRQYRNAATRREQAPAS